MSRPVPRRSHEEKWGPRERAPRREAGTGEEVPKKGREEVAPRDALMRRSRLDQVLFVYSIQFAYAKVALNDRRVIRQGWCGFDRHHSRTPKLPPKMSALGGKPAFPLGAVRGSFGTTAYCRGFGCALAQSNAPCRVVTQTSPRWAASQAISSRCATSETCK